MQVQLLDPSAFTPPYDRALAAALARAGLDVELLTSRFLYGPVPPAEGFRAEEFFYRASARRGLTASGRRAFKAAEHLSDLMRYRRRARRSNSDGPDIVHHQWFTFPELDPYLYPRRAGCPRVLTAHYILPPQADRLARLRARAALRRMDAIITHTEIGARRLREEVGVSPEKVHLIPHGVFDYLTRLPSPAPLPPEFATPAAPESARSSSAAPESVDDVHRPPVVLFFGLLRPYKGIEVLLEAFRSVPDAELWIAGNARMDVGPLREAATLSASPVHFAPRFIGDDEIPSLFRAADLVVLPYRDIEQSGVLYTALAFGKPLILTEVGGFPEVVRRTGAGALVPPADPAALAAEIRALLGDDARRAQLARAATAAAEGYYSWDSVAEKTVALYRNLVGGLS